MKEAINVVPVFSVEMSHVYYLARLSWFYRFIHTNLAAIKFSMYVRYYYVLSSEIDIVW